MWAQRGGQELAVWMVFPFCRRPPPREMLGLAMRGARGDLAANTRHLMSAVNEQAAPRPYGKDPFAHARPNTGLEPYGKDPFADVMPNTRKWTLCVWFDML